MVILLKLQLSVLQVVAEQGVLAWNGHGRLRISFHGYNSMDDVRRILAELPPIWRP